MPTGLSHFWLEIAAAVLIIDEPCFAALVEWGENKKRMYRRDFSSRINCIDRIHYSRIVAIHACATL